MTHDAHLWDRIRKLEHDNNAAAARIKELEEEVMVHRAREPASAIVGHPAAETASPFADQDIVVRLRVMILEGLRGFHDPHICGELTAAAEEIGKLRMNLTILRADLLECREHLDKEMDVVDGPDGQPAPNRAMQLVNMIDEALHGPGGF